MKRPTDDILVAYADGKLTAAEADAVDDFLAGDEEARRFVAALRGSADLVREAFEEPMNAPPSRSLVDMILASPPHPAQQVNVVELRTRAGRVSSWRPDRSAWKPMAMAASVALFVGIVAGSQLPAGLVGPAGSELSLGPISTSSVLHAALERRSTGDTLALKPESDRRRQKLSMVATFRDRLDRPCREVELVTDTPDTRPLAAAVACRAGDGRWIVEGATRVASADPGAGGGTFYPSGIREKDAVEGLLNMLGAGKSLSAAEERELMANGWRK